MSKHTVVNTSTLDSLIRGTNAAFSIHKWWTSQLCFQMCFLYMKWTFQKAI